MASYRLHRLFNANLSKEMEKMFCVLFDMGMAEDRFPVERVNNLLNDKE